MTLEPCKVCRTLNSSESEICLSCGYPTAGRKRPLIFQLAAIIVVIALITPLFFSLINWLKFNLIPIPQQKSPRQSDVSLLQTTKN